MKNKKIYEAPFAQTVLFAPREDISVSFGKNNGWWGLENSAWWGARTNASVVTAGISILDEDQKSWELPD